MQPAREWAKRMQKLQYAHRALPLWQPDSMADLLVILWQLRVWSCKVCPCIGLFPGGPCVKVPSLSSHSYGACVRHTLVLTCLGHCGDRHGSSWWCCVSPAM
jgi:hypothetical protein